MSRAVAVVLLAGLLAACQTAAGSFCDVSSPIRPSASDSLTDGTARQVLTHNLTGARLCHWKP